MLVNLPASLATVRAKIILRALPAVMATPEAQVMLLAIGLQESQFKTRKQTGGPARGFWQFERVGVRGVLNHPSSKGKAAAFCAAAGVEPSESMVYGMLDKDDLLACQIARLLLWTDPAPLPALGDADAAWAYYLRTWQPGKPHPEHWAGRYASAVQAVQR